MAQEAVVIELGANQGRPIRGTILDSLAITKRAVMTWLDPRTLSGANAAGDPFAGIAAMDKEINDVKAIFK